MLLKVKNLVLRNVCLTMIRTLDQEAKHRLLRVIAASLKDENDIDWLIANLPGDQLDSHLIAPALYLHLTSNYSAEEKPLLMEHLFKLAIGDTESTLRMFRSKEPILYQKVMSDSMLCAVRSTHSILPTKKKGLAKIDYELVRSNEFKLCEPDKSYGHNEYYQCLWAIAEDVNHEIRVYHFNPNRLNHFGDESFFANSDHKIGMDDTSLKYTQRITLVMHERSFLAYWELQQLQKLVADTTGQNLQVQTICLPTGMASVALSYHPQFDTLTVLNIEAQQTVYYEDLRAQPMYNKDDFNPKKFFLKLLNYGLNWKSALNETLQKYIENRESWSKYTCPRSNGLFHNPKTTGKNIALAKDIIHQLDQGLDHFDRQNLSKRDELYKLLDAVEKYQNLTNQLQVKVHDELGLQIDQTNQLDHLNTH